MQAIVPIAFAGQYRKRMKRVKMMKKIPISSRVFAILAALLAVLVLVICLSQRSGLPLLLGSTEKAEACARNFMERICAGDYAGASDFLYGTPSLGDDAQRQTPASQLIWDAFLSSLSSRPQGDCYADENGLAQDYILSGLDIPSLVAKLKEAVPTVLEAQVDAAENFAQVYDDNWQYREEFAQSVLEETARQVTAGIAPEERQITLRLAFEDGQWWVVPDQQLITAISGGIL